MKKFFAFYLFFNCYITLMAQIDHQKDKTINKSHHFHNREDSIKIAGIIGGSETSNPGYIVSIHVQALGIGFVGSGVILDEKTIITAAHVVDNVRMVPSEVQIRAGGDSKYLYTQVSVAEQIILHPDFPLNLPSDPTSPDIAIIKLLTPLTFNEDVFSIKFARHCIFENSDPEIGDPIIIHGWGSTNLNYNDNLELRTAFSDVINLPQSSFWSSEPYYQLYFNSTLNFATYNFSNQAYRGDSGGPGVIIKNGIKYLVGIISWGRDPNLSNDPTKLYPDVFTNVITQTEFIVNNLEAGTYPCDFSNPELSNYEGSLCQSVNVDLNNFFIGTLPPNTTLVWSTDNYQFDCVDNPFNGIASEGGTYYAYFFNANEQCYSQPSEPFVLIPNCEAENDLLVSTNTSLNANVTYKNITISNNATLTIPSGVKIQILNKIVVEYGSKLIIDGGIVSGCPDCPKWKGIQAIGNPFTGQTYAVELKNGGIVENAEIGINTSNIVNGGIFGPQFDLSGAKVTVEGNSIFRNCDIGINFGPYGYSGPYFSWEDASYIHNSTFADCNIGVKLRSNLGVDILNSDFLGISTSGVEIINSQVEVSGCEFEGTTGVFFGATWPSLLGSNIKVNSFFTSVEGVLIDGQGNATEHTIGGNLFASGNGIVAAGQSSFNIQNNEFGDNHVGVGTDYTGDDGNMISDNNFNLNEYGSSVYGLNNTEYLNNCFVNGSSADIEIYHEASIYDEQGDFENAAGNCFTKTVPSFITGIDAESFTYFVKTGTIPQSCKYPIGGIWDLEDSDFENPLNCGFGFWGNFPPRYRNCVIPSTLVDKKAMELAIKAEIKRIKGDPNISPLVKKWLIARYERCLKRLIGKIVEDIIKTPNTGREDAITYLSAQELFSHRIMAYSLMIEAGDYTSAVMYLNGLATNRNAEFDFVTAQNIYQDYLQQGTSYVLNAQDTALIGNIAREKNELSGYARNIYYEMTGEKIKLTMPHLPFPGSRPVSQENVELPKVLLYPNPVDNNQVTLEVSVKFIHDKCTMQITDVTGNMVLNNTLNTESTPIDITALRPGMYFVKVSDQKQILFTGKLIRL
ncbi:MAG: trypsin-like serine protease [Saprospiraceae bacterium]